MIMAKSGWRMVGGASWEKRGGGGEKKGTAGFDVGRLDTKKRPRRRRRFPCNAAAEFARKTDPKKDLRLFQKMSQLYFGRMSVERREAGGWEKFFVSLFRSFVRNKKGILSLTCGVYV